MKTDIRKRGKCLFCCLLVVVLLLAQNGYLYAADSLPDGTTFTEDGLEYIVMRSFYNPPTVRLEGPAEGTVVTGELVISGQVVHDGITYNVTSIQYDAFQNCTELTSVRILDNVEYISFTGAVGVGAFAGCSNLKTVELPNTLTSIGCNAFRDCSSLTSINIPANVTEIQSQAFQGCKSLKNISIPNGVTVLDNSVFNGCSNLTHIELPNSITGINNAAFWGCTSLTSITIPKNCTVYDSAFSGCSSLMTVEMYDSVKLNDYAFFNCYRLGTLRLHIESADGTVARTVACTGNPFEHYGDLEVERNLVFLTGDGAQRLSEQTIPTLSTAQSAYQQVADGNTTDNLWYGWKISSSSVSSHEVDIQVKKDNGLWSDHGKRFRLSKDGRIFVDNLTTVEDGTYHIYELTASGNVDTGQVVTVNGADTEAEINYYTVTFYDGQNAYGNGTDWEPQIVLAGKQAQAPTVNPSKTDYTFEQWVREEDGKDAYGFDTVITDTTSIYASWLPVVDEHTIRATAGEGGSISPNGSVRVSDKTEQIFTMIPQDGYRIRSVTVDGVEQGEISRYVFKDVQADHEISVTFEAVDNTTETEEPGEPAGTEEPGNTTETEAPGEPAGTEAPDKSDDSGNSDAAGASQASTEVNTVASNNTSSHGKNGPGTGDMFQMEFYATAAMISGFAYLMIYFTDPEKGMSEEEKKNRVKAWIQWGRQGGSLRRYVALMIIFFLLLYYHQQTHLHGSKHIV